MIHVHRIAMKFKEVRIFNFLSIFFLKIALVPPNDYIIEFCKLLLTVVKKAFSKLTICSTFIIRISTFFDILYFTCFHIDKMSQVTKQCNITIIVGSLG